MTEGLFTCTHCGRSTCNPWDAWERYCGACRHFCDDVALFASLFEVLPPPGAALAG